MIGGIRDAIVFFFTALVILSTFSLIGVGVSWLWGKIGKVSEDDESEGWPLGT